MEHKAAIAEDGSRDIPPLVAFEVEIAKAHAVETEIQQMPSITAEGLLHINARPLKQALIVLVSKWIYLYTQSLQQRVWLLHFRILCAQSRHMTVLSACSLPHTSCSTLACCKALLARPHFAL